MFAHNRLQCSFLAIHYELHTPFKRRPTESDSTGLAQTVAGTSAPNGS